MKTSVVCVSHATGAGGNEVGRLVAERLGFRYVDEDLVSQAALRAGVDASEIADEERRKSWLNVCSTTSQPEEARLPWP